MTTATAGARRKLLVIWNPAAGQRRGGLYRGTLAALEAAGATCTVAPTARRGDAEAFARAATAATYDAVVAAGGDGTINEVVNGMTGGPLPLGLLPLGTANVLAREIGLGRTPAALAETILRGNDRTVYAGRADGRLFAAIAGVGFDAEIVEAISLRLKKRLGRWAYAVAGVKCLLRFAGTPLEITTDGVPGAASMLIVNKGRLYGGSFVCAPRASLEVPDLHAVLVNARHRRGLVRAALSLARGRLDSAVDVRIVPARTIAVAGPAGVPVQGDGDTVARVPVTFRIETTPYRLLVP